MVLISIQNKKMREFYLSCFSLFLIKQKYVLYDFETTVKMAHSVRISNFESDSNYEVLFTNI